MSWYYFLTILLFWYDGQLIVFQHENMTIKLRTRTYAGELFYQYYFSHIFYASREGANTTISSFKMKNDGMKYPESLLHDVVIPVHLLTYIHTYTLGGTYISDFILTWKLFIFVLHSQANKRCKILSFQLQIQPKRCPTLIRYYVGWCQARFLTRSRSHWHCHGINLIFLFTNEKTKTMWIVHSRAILVYVKNSMMYEIHHAKVGISGTF